MVSALRKEIDSAKQQLSDAQTREAQLWRQLDKLTDVVKILEAPMNPKDNKNIHTSNTQVSK